MDIHELLKNTDYFVEETTMDGIDCWVLREGGGVPVIYESKKVKTYPFEDVTFCVAFDEENEEVGGVISAIII